MRTRPCSDTSISRLERRAFRRRTSAWPAGLGKRQKADAAGERLATLKHRLGQHPRVAHQEALRPVAQGQVDQRGVLAADGQEVGDHADHGLPWPRLRLVEERQDLAHAGPQPFVTAFEPLQHLDPAGQAAALLAQVRDSFVRCRRATPQAFSLQAQLGQCLAGRLQDRPATRHRPRSALAAPGRERPGVPPPARSSGAAVRARGAGCPPEPCS